MRNFCFAFCIALILCINQAFGSEAGMPQLNPEFWTAQIFWLILIFSSLYLIIWKIFLPRITYSIENRKSRLVNDLDEAQKLKENAEKKLDRDIENKKQKFNDEIEKELIAIEKEIKDLKKSSVLNINRIATEITTEIIKQIINSEVNKSSVSAIVNDVTKRQMEKQI